MSKIPKSKWTKLEKEFDKLVNMSESKHQLTRIIGRTKLRDFATKHGNEKLDLMLDCIN